MLEYRIKIYLQTLPPSKREPEHIYVSIFLMLKTDSIYPPKSCSIISQSIADHITHKSGTHGSINVDFTFVVIVIFVVAGFDEE